VKTPKGARSERVIKRYDNRKLYDPEARRYVTLDDLARQIGAGEEVRVVDQRTGDDLTTVILAQVMLEGLKQRTANIPHQVLTRLIRLGHTASQTAALGKAGAWAEWTGPSEAAAKAKDEAERIVSGLLSRGRLTLDEALALRQEMAGSVQRIVQDAQAGLESRLRRLMERSESEHGVNPALLALKTRLLTFENLLAPAPPPRPARPAQAPKPKSKPKPHSLKRRT
jgi:polyhydroxyalkanoate synthesis repressor PhaR